ncbi:3-dehydro-L-gulonate 2-dehydrogenase [Flavisolibacter ginsenosidimutans]|uniref:3-dehydro-L-gulonate 2-dehydrogenase n=1 Tax=Flavisolibacter ginsenosidimutans TaxID=661481 RepID=A0A5B8UFQ4_9BACT|nr:3-dehydro-L-gulonate 2-dehydrogenase [Flavisolibacter ginsenosidimutans]QEC55252.1 3-dehydro-L-gulonate 2-dehydrogenase [Flavisolibacter ginsenosidimutans]
MTETILVPAGEMKQIFLSILLSEGFTNERAEALAEVFTTNSVDGVYTHGVNRFPVFMQYVKEGFVKKEAKLDLQSAFNGMEQWNGNLGAGPLNAIAATERAMQLAQQFGIGCVALAHTNHWMRAGYYGWQAARKGFALIAWTNTTALMPAWGAVDAKLGNNPLMMALPYENEAIVLDTAMSQYSFGAMEQAKAKGEKLQVVSGYDKEGNLTDDPSAILESRRPLPIGYWKGAGLSLLLDILAAVFSGGLSVNEITKQEKEHGLSQVFICIDLGKIGNASMIAQTLSSIINDFHQSKTKGKKIHYPGERLVQTRKENLQNGVPVLKTAWQAVLNLNA